MKPLLSGFRGFALFWFGQVISLLGTNMSGFAITIWAYEKTGSATALALAGFFFVAPLLILSPVAGALVDRSNRKLMMMISDLASGMATVFMLILYTQGKLEIWHLYIANAVSGAFQAFQWPAFSAAISLMVPKQHLVRANSMMDLADTGAGIISPLLAGALLGFIGLQGLFLIDIATFIFAISVLIFIFVPQPPVTQAGLEGKGNLWQESVYGFKYILKRPSLLGLQLVFLLGNFIFGIAMAVRAPMILARTGSNELIFGTVNSVAAIGGVLGGLVMSAWGGFKRRVHGVLLGWALSGLVGEVLMGVGQGVLIWSAAGFLGSALVPLINGSNQAIWQSKVAPDVQGRVFSIRRLIAWVSSPLSMLIAGPLADYVLEPAMQPEGSLAPLFGPLVGTGPGAGMALMFIFSGSLVILVGLGGYLFPAIRNAETLLPDHDTPPLQETAAKPALAD